MNALGIEMPRSHEAYSVEEALKIADELGVTVGLVRDYRAILEGMAEPYRMIQR